MTRVLKSTLLFLIAAAMTVSLAVTDTATAVPATKLIVPTAGKISSGYGWRWGRRHRGIDIAAATGTVISASDYGIVTSAGWNGGGYGYMVDIQHQNGVETVYAHASKLLVRPGQLVEVGQTVALVGSTGRSTGPHLHWEVWRKGETIDPCGVVICK